MRRIFKYMLLTILSIVMLCGVLLGVVAYKQLPVFKELDEIAKRNPAELATYFETKVNKENVVASMQWLRMNAETSNDFIVPLLYSNFLVAAAKENQEKISQEKYTDIMTTASIMYVFADATMYADYLRCKDKTSQAGVSAVRAMYMQPIYEFLANEASASIREKVFVDGFAHEERIASRPPNLGACSHGLSVFTGKAIEYIPLEEWTELRISAIRELKKAFTNKFLTSGLFHLK